jgi:DNA polymerase III delta prime subunit
MAERRQRAILIAGPTASGKSAAALELAQALGGSSSMPTPCRSIRAQGPQQSARPEEERWRRTGCSAMCRRPGLFGQPLARRCPPGAGGGLGAGARGRRGGRNRPLFPQPRTGLVRHSSRSPEIRAGGAGRLPSAGPRRCMMSLAAVPPTRPGACGRPTASASPARWRCSRQPASRWGPPCGPAATEPACRRRRDPGGDRSRAERALSPLR